MADPSGISFPFRFDLASGRVATAEGSVKIRGNLRALVLTAPSERLMRPEIGIPSYDRTFRNAGSQASVLFAAFVRDKLAAFEPLVAIVRVAVTQSESQEGTLEVVDISYMERATKAQDSVSVTLPGV